MSSGTDSVVVSKWNPSVALALASASKNTIGVWDVATDNEAPVCQISIGEEAAKKAIMDMAWTSNGATLAAVTSANGIELVDPRSSKTSASVSEVIRCAQSNTPRVEQCNSV